MYLCPNMNNFDVDFCECRSEEAILLTLSVCTVFIDHDYINYRLQD